MLFSNEDVARFINQNFEAAWESVRPVPLIQINFGGGTTVTRTLHGRNAAELGLKEIEVVPLEDGPGNEVRLFRSAVDALARQYVNGTYHGPSKTGPGDTPRKQFLGALSR